MSRLKWVYGRLPKKSIQLTSSALDALLRDGQGEDFRLNAPVWDGVRVGDTLEFWEDFTGWQTEPTTSSRRVLVRVDAFTKAEDFYALGLVLERGEDGARALSESLSRWWSFDRQRERGVLCWHVSVVG